MLDTLIVKNNIKLQYTSIPQKDSVIVNNYNTVNTIDYSLQVWVLLGLILLVSLLFFFKKNKTNIIVNTTTPVSTEKVNYTFSSPNKFNYSETKEIPIENNLTKINTENAKSSLNNETLLTEMDITSDLKRIKNIYGKRD